MKCTRAELVKLQQTIAEGRLEKLVELRQSMTQRTSGVLPDRPLEDGEFYWHPKFRLALRVYNSGRGIWICKYRNKRGLERTHGIGSATVINTTMAETAAKLVLGKVAQGEDPQGERAELLARPKITVGALCEQFFEEMRASPKMSFRTVRGYANSARRHLGALRNMQADELDAQAVVVRVREIAKHSTYNADTFRAMLASVYNWAKLVYPATIVVNPVTGTWRPERKPTTGQALTMEQLGAIWRACEMVEGMAIPMLRNGQAANRWDKVEGADDDLIGIMQAARLAGFDRKTLENAVRNGTLPLVDPKGIRPAGANAHGRIPHCTTVGALNRYIDARAMRSRRGDYCKVVRLAMLFGARYGEMAGLRWSELPLWLRESNTSPPLPHAALALDRKKLAAFSALGGGFLQFPIGDRRRNRTRASVGNAGGNARPSLTNATLAASRLLHRRSPTRALIERCIGRPPKKVGAFSALRGPVRPAGSRPVSHRPQAMSLATRWQPNTSTRHGATALYIAVARLPCFRLAAVAAHALERVAAVVAREQY